MSPTNNQLKLRGCISHNTLSVIQVCLQCPHWLVQNTKGSTWERWFVFIFYIHCTKHNNQYGFILVFIYTVSQVVVSKWISPFVLCLCHIIVTLTDQQESHCSPYMGPCYLWLVGARMSILCMTSRDWPSKSSDSAKSLSYRMSHVLAAPKKEQRHLLIQEILQLAQNGQPCVFS